MWLTFYGCRSPLSFLHMISFILLPLSLMYSHSLVHGDLWSGNSAYCQDGSPCIYDPAVYYGDREVDIAMTRLFGGHSREFYASYDEQWALPEGWEDRQTIYNAYHILNHFVLFGGGYLQQGKSMLNKVLSF